MQQRIIGTTREVNCPEKEREALETLLFTFFTIWEPEALKAWKGQIIKCKVFWPFSGCILYIKIWGTNRNPHLVASYYLEAAQFTGGVPLVTQSDPGSENIRITNCHTQIRQVLDPSLCNMLQHRIMWEKMNIKPEVCWSLLRRGWSPGFENLQEELDAWKNTFNHSLCRADRHKVLLHGILDLIWSKPECYGSVDFKVPVAPELLDAMHQHWAPPDYAVFQLVPPPFHALTQHLYQEIGSPSINDQTFWNLYGQLRHLFDLQPPINTLDHAIQSCDCLAAEEIPILQGLKLMRLGGGVSQPSILTSIDALL
ncbi:hypothetical protein V8D89_009380 [Ganoderma adspersum]